MYCHVKCFYLNCKSKYIVRCVFRCFISLRLQYFRFFYILTFHIFTTNIISAMAKKVQTKSTEEILWDAANKLRGSIEPSEYKHVVLSLIFLKFASDKFIKRRSALIAEGKEAF